MADQRIVKKLRAIIKDPEAIAKLKRVMADAQKESLYLIMAGKGCFTDPRLPDFVATI